MNDEVTNEPGKTLEQLWCENNNHLPMAVMWFSGGHVCKNDHRAVILRFNRGWQFVHGWPFIIWPVSSVVMQSLSTFRNHDGTYNVIGKPFVKPVSWLRASYYRIGSGFYHDSTQEVLDMWHKDHEVSVQARRGVFHLEVEEAKKRDTMEEANSRPSEG